MYKSNLKDLWVEGCEQQLMELDDSKHLALYSEFPYHDCILMQCTGRKLKDTLLFGGDIISNGKEEFEVFYDDNILQWRARSKTQCLKTENGMLCNVESLWALLKDYDCEIIGNIHQTKEEL